MFSCIWIWCRAFYGSQQERTDNKQLNKIAVLLRTTRGISIASKPYVPSDTRNPKFTQHHLDPGWISPTAHGTDPIHGEKLLLFGHSSYYTLFACK